MKTLLFCVSLLAWIGCMTSSGGPSGSSPRTPAEVGTRTKSKLAQPKSKLAQQGIRYEGAEFLVAALRGELELVKLLVLTGMSVDTTDKIGVTALHGAASKGHLSVVKYLVGQGASVNAMISDRGYAALLLAADPLLAAEGGRLSPEHLDIVQYLGEQGARVTATDIGLTVLHHAAREGHLDIVQYLVEQGARVTATDNSGRTPKNYAAGEGHTAVVEYLESVGG